MKQLQDTPWKVRQQTDDEIMKDWPATENGPQDDKDIMDSMRGWLVETASGEFIADCGCRKDAEMIAGCITFLPQMAETWRMLLNVDD